MSLLLEFIYAADQLVKYYAAAKELSDCSHTLSALETRKQELKELWTAIKAAHASCARAADTEEGSQNLDMSIIDAKYRLSSETFVACSTLFIDQENRLKPRLENHNLPQTLTASHPQAAVKGTNETAYQPCIKVPPCDTETFHGDYLSWPSFRDMFDAVYRQYPKLGDVQKLFHLRAKTSGDAHNIVSKFPLTNTSFELAWESLRSTYENTRLLVNNQIKLLCNLPLKSEESAKAIKALQRSINDCLTALHTHKIDTTSWDPILVYACSSRLPPLTLALWEQSLKDPTEVPKWSQLDLFLNCRYQVLESIADMSASVIPIPSRQQPNRKAPSRTNKGVSTYHIKSNIFACKLCGSHHSLRNCPEFRRMNAISRKEFVLKHRFCLNCLAYNHLAGDCTSKFTCTFCKGKHHSMLHPEAKQHTPHLHQPLANNSIVPSTANINNQTTSFNQSQLQSTSQPFILESNNHSFVTSIQKQVLLATALVQIKSQGITHTIRALIDPASEVSFISSAVQKRLRLPVSPINTTISGISASHAASANKLCSFYLVNHEEPSSPLAVQAIVLKRLTDNLPVTSFNPIQIAHLTDFHLADPTYHRSSQVDLLLGADLYPTIIRQGLKHLSTNVVAQKTVFGWILSGPLSTNVSSFTTKVSLADHTLDEQLKKFWELEEIPNTYIYRSEADHYCENFYKRTTARRPDGRYVVRLPFRPEVPSKLKLGMSRNLALKQFLRTEKSLSRNITLQSQYTQVIYEYLTLNHMRKVSPLEKVGNDSVSSFYLPHHAVIKPESVSTKLRVVFNASNASSNGKSLNDLLFPGPTLQRDLTSLILRWRFFRFVFNADIEKMYRQILIHPDDAAFQRILFREDEQSEIEDYELLTVTFGVNCAPYLALRTLIQLAEDQAHEFPLASEILKRDFYVDDVLSGAHDLHAAKAAQIELIKSLAAAGFALRKWTSNSPYILRHLPRDHILTETFLNLDVDSTVKTLGVHWNAKEDHFYFTIQPVKYCESPTKREMLSQIARLFDPAGWLAPIIITAKILMQDTWVDQTNRDAPLSPVICLKWNAFINTLPEIENVKIPRWVEYSPSASTQLHGFCDTSEKAYAAALYIRVTNRDGIVQTHLVCSKTKVAPIKPVSLPRLELCGAVLLSELIKAYLPTFPINSFRLFLWTDSAIVLAWLQKPPRTWKTFVANRTAKIAVNLGADSSNWLHIRSVENPADLATRGLTPQDLKASSLWWKGPSWLREAEDQWPVSSPALVPEENLEIKPIFCAVAQNYEEILGRFSSLPRALRVISYIFRFFHRISRRPQSDLISTHEVSPAEVNFVKIRLILLAQCVHFQNERQLLSAGKPIPNKSSILSLTPMLDPDKLLRVNGRLARSTLPYNERHPIILPYSSHLSHLIVHFIHDISIHGGNALMLRLIRQTFWIPKVKNLIKSCIRNCKPCIVHRQQMRKQIMAALPIERCSFSPPFTYTGVDFAGPFEIKSFSGRNCRITKGYACLFVCFATKAIHLEAASDLSSQVFLAAFARFVARRGLPKKVFSDHGTNFVGAHALLQKDFKRLHASMPSLTCSKYGIQGFSWVFIPPGTPHMGGLWEAGVKSFKTHFRKTASTTRLTFEEFVTLLSRIEACLNSRPLSRVSDDPTDLLALTPGHFIRGAPLLAPPEPEIQNPPLSIINRWERLKYLHQEFCRRWKQEYLAELHKRYKWKHPNENVKVNDLVVVRNENLPPTEWRLGRVVRVCPGPEGRVRVATIKTQVGELTRPIVKLCVLPSD